MNKKTYRLCEVRKILHIDESRLRKLLRKNKIFDELNMPYQKYVAAGLFIIKGTTYTDNFGDRRCSKSSRRITEKGLVHISNLVAFYKKELNRQSIERAQAARTEKDTEETETTALWKKFNRLWKPANETNYCKI